MGLHKVDLQEINWKGKLTLIQRESNPNFDEGLIPKFGKVYDWITMCDEVAFINFNKSNVSPRPCPCGMVATNAAAEHVCPCLFLNLT